MKIPTIIEDERAITCIGGEGEDGLCHNTRAKGAYYAGVTRIVPYREDNGNVDGNGDQMSDLWFAVFKGAKLHVKVQGKYVAEVFYADPPKAIEEAGGDERRP